MQHQPLTLCIHPFLRSDYAIRALGLFWITRCTPPSRPVFPGAGALVADSYTTARSHAAHVCRKAIDFLFAFGYLDDECMLAWRLRNANACLNAVLPLWERERFRVANGVE